MADNIPAEIVVAIAKVSAWESRPPKPGELPPLDVHAAALQIESYRAAQGAGQQVERAVDRFKRMVRQDTPPEMPAWDPALARSQSQPA